ncbi:MAG: ArsR family transcriptional regulator [archaeon]|nr:ArsR family transcriptional regulator [archaeon]
MNKKTPINKIYLAFYQSKRHRLYYNQLKEHTGLSDSSVQNALKKLKETREIKQIKEKSNTYYQLKNKDMIRTTFTIFDYEKLESLDIDIKTPLKQFVSLKPKEDAFVIFFGSASRDMYKKNSDIDLLVILNSFENKRLKELYEKETKNSFEKLKEKINASSIYPINIIYADIDKYKKNNDRVVTEAKNTGFCIDGNLLYHDVMFDELQDKRMDWQPR